MIRSSDRECVREHDREHGNAAQGVEPGKSLVWMFVREHASSVDCPFQSD